MEEKKQMSKRGYTILGIISMIISLLLFPPVFGFLSIFCGYKIHKKWDERLGLTIITFGAICMIIGIIIGYYSGI